MDEKNRHLTFKEIAKIADESIGKTFGDLGLSEYRDKNNKGGYGNFVEENVFCYPANSDDNPDFIDEAIELKLTPVKKNKDGTLSAKERLILNKINYFDEASATFETSSFYKKNKKLLIMFYSYAKGVPETKFSIMDYKLFEFEESFEYKTIKRDWETIHNKIKAGKAHELSDSDTTFLGATTKASKSTDRTKQPFGPDAKPRAYSFKGNFMTRLIRKWLDQTTEFPKLVTEEEWMERPLEDLYIEKLQKYVGKTVEELKKEFSIKKKPKQLNFMLAQKMLGLKGKDSSTEEMLDAGIKLKTVQLNKKGYPKEAMSFPFFDFSELIDTQWEESEIREDFLDWKLMIFVFKETDNGVVFDGIKFWNIPGEIVDGVIKDMFNTCADLISKGDAFEKTPKGKLVDKFPKEKKRGNGVCHVRPHGRNKKDIATLPIPDKATGITSFTKQCFWFNREYIHKILNTK